MRVSIVIPVFNDHQALSDLLVPLAQAQTKISDIEIIVADGGSTDGSIMLAKQFADEVVQSEKGRANQQNAGAAIAKGEVLWFLHADSQLDFPKFTDYLKSISNASWGRFNISIYGTNVFFPIISFFINLRSCVTGIATGDQGIFVRKKLFNSVGGFPKQALMEDIALSKLLPGKPVCTKSPKISTSGRKWQQEGVIKTILKMWWIRLQYFFGVSPEVLVKQYYK